MDKADYCTVAEHGGGTPKSHENKSSSRRKPTLTSATEGPVVTRWVATLAVQGGGDRGGGGRGDIVLRGAGGQMVVPMRIFEGWHRHVGSVSLITAEKLTVVCKVVAFDLLWCDQARAVWRRRVWQWRRFAFLCLQTAWSFLITNLMPARRKC